MTVYMDNAMIPARVGRTSARWCHMTADTPDELHAFAESIGLRRAWFQTCKRSCGRPDEPCVHWHYDVTEPRRAAAVAAGAREIDIREMGAITSARRAAQRAGAVEPVVADLTDVTNFAGVVRPDGVAPGTAL